MSDQKISICLKCYNDLLVAKIQRDKLISALKSRSKLSSNQRTQMSHNSDSQLRLLRGKLIQISTILDIEFKI